MKFPIVDKKEILKRWHQLISDASSNEASNVMPILLKEGHLRSDQINDLKNDKFTQKLDRWLERLFVESRIPPLVLVHERFRPSQCFIAKKAGPRDSHLFAFSGTERACLTHPFFALQRLMDRWPGAAAYDDGEFLGDAKPCQRDRRLLRDNYLKCWKRWVPAGPARKDFALARQLWPIVEACRLSEMYKEMYKDVFNQHKRKQIISTFAPVLRQCAFLATSVINGLYDNDETAGGPKKTGLRPVRAWVSVKRKKKKKKKKRFFLCFLFIFK